MKKKDTAIYACVCKEHFWEDKSGFTDGGQL